MDLFARPKPVIAMIHTGPSPGLPGFRSVESAVERAVAEAEIYLDGGVDGLLIENMHDFPCVHEREMGPEVGAFLTRVAHEVKRRAAVVPVGIQVLFQANRTALAVALAAGCDFIRAEGWTYAHVSDKGVAEACAGAVYRYRHQMGADHVRIFADLRKKHAAHAWTADLSIAEVAATMALHRADAVIVTGATTGAEPALEDLHAVHEASPLPLLIGSGVTAENVHRFAPVADGFIIGSAFKERGEWDRPVCETRVREIVTAVDKARAFRSAVL